MFFNNSRGNINVGTSIIIFLVCVVIAIGVAIFHHYYYPSKYLENKAFEISELFDGEGKFSKVAKNLLNTRSDVGYVKLLDENGVLEESFGDDSKEGTKKFLFNGPENKSVVLGLKNDLGKQIDTYPLVWSLLIGTVLSFLLIFLLFLQSPKQGKAFKKLERAMQRVSQGDLHARLEIDSSSDEDMGILNAYQGFNRMVEILNKRFKAAESEPIELKEFVAKDEFDLEIKEDLSVDAIVDEEKELADEVIVDNEVIDNNEVEVFEEKDEKEIKQFELTEDDIKSEAEVVKNESEVSYSSQINGDSRAVSELSSNGEDESEFSAFRPKIVLPQESLYPKNRNVTVFVAKISDFNDLSDRLDSSDLSSFLTRYRKSASSIISGYGGVIEALLQDEIVAIFNAPEEQEKAELRSICAAVEVLHELATMTKERKNEGKEIIGGKIGIGLREIPFYSDSGVPDSVKVVIDNARDICDSANLWKVYVSSSLYQNVQEYVDAKEYLVDGETFYSITGVEEGVVEV